MTDTEDCTTSDTEELEEDYEEESSVSSEDGKSVGDFRYVTLKNAKVVFESRPINKDGSVGTTYEDGSKFPGKPIITPSSVSEFISLLSHRPAFEVERGDAKTGRGSGLVHAQSVTDDERSELEAAADYARKVSGDDIHLCRERNKVPWMRLVNNVMLGPLFEAERQGLLSCCEQVEWTKGGINGLISGLDDPTPDCAFGLAKSWGKESEPLCMRNLLALRQAAGIQLAFSPASEGLTVFPAIIYEAEDYKKSIMSPQSHAAVGAVRALALLDELSRLSEVPYQHCVAVLASSGPSWTLHVAFQDERRVLLVPVNRPVWLESFEERVRLAFIMNRLKRWMLGPYRSKIAEQVETLLRRHQASQSLSSTGGAETL